MENYAAVVEQNPTIRGHLRQLIKRRISLVEVSEQSDYTTFALPSDFYRLLRQTAKATRANPTANCNEEREILVSIIQSDDLSESLLRDPNWKPSYNWKETFAIESGNDLMVFKYDELDIKEFIIDYVMGLPDSATPSLIDCAGGYRDSSGNTITGDNDFLIDSSYIWRKVVDVAVLLTELDFGDVQNYQARLANILQLDKVYLI